MEKLSALQERGWGEGTERTDETFKEARETRSEHVDRGEGASSQFFH